MANGLCWNAIQAQAALSGARVEPRPPREEAARGGGGARSPPRPLAARPGLRAGPRRARGRAISTSYTTTA